MATTVLLLAPSAYVPDDGTQGYTPYFYKMDVPVRVRQSISYGRAWQLLRSRGAGSNYTGPCDPPQRASSCNCSAGRSTSGALGTAASLSGEEPPSRARS